LLLSGVTVRFDDLHKSLTSKVHVPLIGDLVFSRWAYEALAVEQSKNNCFEKNFYPYDQAISEATFTNSYLITRLINKLDECNRNLDTDGDFDLLASNLELIHNEVEKLGNHPELAEFEYLSSLNINGFNEEVSAETVGWLNYYVREYFLDLSRQVSNQRDKVYADLVDSLGTDEVFYLRQKYQNNRLDEIVTARDDFVGIIEVNGRLVQKDDPIFMIPESNFGRAHFYAPYKKLNDQLYDTKWFNLGVLWGFSFIFYVTLLLDIPRILIMHVNNLKFQRRKKGLVG
jgi:hypothetical protein